MRDKNIISNTDNIKYGWTETKRKIFNTTDKTRKHEGIREILVERQSKIFPNDLKTNLNVANKQNKK